MVSRAAGGVALTGTQKSEYWTMPHICSLSLEFFDLALLALNTEILAWLIPAHSVYLLFHNPRRAFVTAPPVVISSAAWAGDLTCTPIPDGGICEDAALFWSSCDHEPTSRSPIRRPRPSLCPGSTGVSNNGKARQGKPAQRQRRLLVSVHARVPSYNYSFSP